MEMLHGDAPSTEPTNLPLCKRHGSSILSISWLRWTVASELEYLTPLTFNNVGDDDEGESCRISRVQSRVSGRSTAPGRLANVWFDCQ
jgi:hypothetical protein